jgi:excisionase family DNA binding protein
MTDLDNWITTSQACELSGYHPDYVRKLLQSGRINGRKWGNSWMVDRSSLVAYLERVESKGGRRGPKRKVLD